MKKNQFQDYICRPWCLFFKAGQKEDLACRGAELVQELISVGRLKPDQVARLRKNPGGGEERDPVLKTRICPQCAFHAQDCDFHSDCPPFDAEPCGAYLLLSVLQKEGIITWSDLENLLHV